jgi:sugar fermentation stimulation protein A
MTVLHRYPPLIQGTLVKRYKRFFADVALEDGSIVTAHCPNTGPMSGVSTPGSAVALSKSTNPARKLAYTWEMIQAEGVWIGINTALPNRIVHQGLLQHAFPELETYTTVQPEVSYGTENSRIDFLLTGDEKPTYVEVKNTTWTRLLPEGRQALFPDCVTTRGQKHLRELTRMVESGDRSAVIFFVNRSDCRSFCPGDEADPLYGQLLRQAVSQGMLALPYCFETTLETVRLIGLASLDL